MRPWARRHGPAPGASLVVHRLPRGGFLFLPGRERVWPLTQVGWDRGTGEHGGVPMKELAIRVREDEQGMSTAEYAVGTVAVCGLGGVLIKLLSSDEFASLLWRVISKAFSFLF